MGLLILCTTTPDQLIPASSAAASAVLGISGGAMDVNAACAGFTYGLVTAAGMVAAGMERVLLIGAETLTRATNWDDRTNAFLFGDGAGAVVIEAIPGDGSLLGWDLGVDGSLVHLLYADHGSGMAMRGQEVFRKAVRVDRRLSQGVDGTGQGQHRRHRPVRPPPGEPADHGSRRARLELPSERIASVIGRTGNTSSASIPLALIDAADSGRLKDGDLVLLAGFGAGMTWASAVWRWGR